MASIVKDTDDKPRQRPGEVPPPLLELLRARGLGGEDEPVCGFAVADMGREGDWRETLLVLTERRLVLIPAGDAGASGEPPVMHFAGTRTGERTWRAASLGDFEVYERERLSAPELLNQVTGGLLVLSVDGEPRWLCRFSGARLRELRRFTDELERLLPKKAEESSAEADGGEHRHRRHGGRGKKGDDKELFCPTCGMPYPEKGRTVCPRCMKRGTVFRRVLAHFKGYGRPIALLMSGILLSSLCNAVWPYLAGEVLYTNVLGKKAGFPQTLGLSAGQFALALGLLVIGMAGIRLLQQVTGIFHGRITGHIVPGVVAKLKDTVFGALQRLSIGYFTNHATGSLMQRVNGDANRVMGFFIDGMPYMLFNVATFIFSGVIMFMMDWRLALLALFLLPPLFFVSYYLLPRLWHAYGRRSRAVRSMYSMLNDDLEGARVVRAFGQEQHENTRFEKVNGRVRDTERGIVRYHSVFDVVYGLVQEVPRVLVWGAGAMLILSSGGAFEFGTLISFVGYLGMLQGPLMFFSNLMRWWSDSMNSAQRIFEIVDALPDVVEADEPVEKDLRGDVSLQNVSFGYEPNRPVLEDISFEVKAGEMLGIVGKSGAGKSTLVNLISRLYDADKGEILLDGVPIRELSFASLRGAVAMVSQETYIFMGTVAENIAYARPDATHDEIVRAAQAASAHSFICRLPDGYDTLVGAGGRQLSGGERQRLSIARAILADPQILVLDEATASVDTETERAIQDALEQLVKGRTTISIAHRLSTLRGADKLIVLDGGKITESGTHKELIHQKGTYFKLVQLQSKALAMRGIE